MMTINPSNDKVSLVDRKCDSPIGLYVHIPFCLRKCAYCDFCSCTPSEGIIDTYFDRLSRELSHYERTPRISVDTLYIGGGTPSILPVGYHTRLHEMLADVFDISGLSEYTVEVNPGTLTLDKAYEYKRLGVNRISIGLQSIHEKELKKLGRIHRYADFLSSYEMLRAIGIDNVSIDLMYGIPLQTKQSFSETLDAVIALNPAHVSVYGLIVEDGTPFAENPSELELPTEDEECDMYEYAVCRLADAGYSHYEISNYAIDGRCCLHNLKYWRCEEYVGIGAAAYSFFEGARYGNTRQLEDAVRDAEVCDGGDAYEYAMMRLRLSEGISLSEYRSRFGEDFYALRCELIDKYVRHGLMSLKGDRLFFTDRGMYVSNTLLVNLL